MYEYAGGDPVDTKDPNGTVVGVDDAAEAEIATAVLLTGALTVELIQQREVIARLIETIHMNERLRRRKPVQVGRGCPRTKEPYPQPRPPKPPEEPQPGPPPPTLEPKKLGVDTVQKFINNVVNWLGSGTGTDGVPDPHAGFGGPGSTGFP